MGGPIQTSPAVTSAQPQHPPRGSRDARPEQAPPPGRSSGAASPGALTMRVLNGRRALLQDAYHWLLNCRWPVFIAMIVGGYMAANLFYATLYTIFPDSINGSTGFWDNFFFSVQTWATIGYGGMTPKTPAANILVVIESMTGIFGVAMLTGLLFAKFSRPDARVLFAEKIAISMYNGKPTLMVRLANERGSNIVEANAHITVIREERTSEGHSMRRIHDLDLVRATQPLFRLSWTIMHTITESSPLWGYDADSAADLRLFVNVMGYDASVGQTAHASQGYVGTDLLFGHRYTDATRFHEGYMVLDFALFHETEPAPLPAGALGVVPVPRPLPSPPSPPSSPSSPLASA